MDDRISGMREDQNSGNADCQAESHSSVKPIQKNEESSQLNREACKNRSSDQRLSFFGFAVDDGNEERSRW
ncbi:hypothetical protein SAY87_009033 [Trapa incisa]|uniref:Uncharacterized protein n=1 Tax=Trapa incisa TaxID=236973 RepID=A0AAN7JWJ2_9MYRT|nr:hypothetical protein SAY87_009033 [Trapa incisa]